MANGRDKRRLAAILAADVVGYSRLMEADESGILAQLKALRKELIDPKVEEYSGRIVKTTGDGILLEFSSVVDAVQMAVDVQRGTARRNESVPEDHRLVFRVGINQSDIIVDGDDILGDGVNIAARLEQLSESGGIRPRLNPQSLQPRPPSQPPYRLQAESLCRAGRVASTGGMKLASAAKSETGSH